jgi:nucleoside-diphosphate-sugar epimerase
VTTPVGDPSQRVLVTGGSGYLATWVIAELLNASWSVRTTLRSPGRAEEVRRAVARIADHPERLSFATADLTDDAGWPEAVAGCRFVLHVASPFPPAQPSDPDELIVPAREGTLRVLRAALDAGAERIVVTSSTAAVDRARGEEPGRVLSEQDWTDPGNPRLSPYVRSKTIAERAAWELVEQRGARERLAVVNPGAILGPVVGEDDSFSLDLVSRLLKGEPAAPRLGYSIVDVRDVARLELLAMTEPAAAGRRFIAVAGFVWMGEIAKLLRAELGSQARRVPRFEAPNLLVRLIGRFDASVRSIVPLLGLRTDYSADRARELLGWRPRPVDETVIDCGRSLAARED